MEIRFLLLFLLTVCMRHDLAAQTRTWDLDIDRAEAKEQQRLDSLAITHKKFLYSSSLYAKIEFPTQLALGYQYIAKQGLAFHGSLGLYPSAFTRVLLDVAPEGQIEDNALQDFFTDRLENGSVTELGVGYYVLKPGLFVLASLQFRKFSISTTTSELIENLSADFDPSDLEAQIAENDILETFFYEETVYPTFRPIMLQLSVGKIFRFSSMPRISLSTQLSYGINLNTSIRVEANSFIGNTVMNNLVNPALADSEQAFEIRGIPSLSLSLNYHFGRLIR